MLKRITMLALLAILTACGNAQTNADDPVTLVSADDENMNKAMADARASFDGFVKKAENPAPGTTNYAVKVKITDDYGVEHFWLTPFEKTADGFTGTIANTPAIVRTVQEGQPYQFTASEVSDWMYMKDDKIYGGYTIRALLPSMPKEEAAQYRAMLAAL